MNKRANNEANIHWNNEYNSVSHKPTVKNFMSLRKEDTQNRSHSATQVNAKGQSFTWQNKKQLQNNNEKA